MVGLPLTKRSARGPFRFQNRHAGIRLSEVVVIYRLHLLLSHLVLLLDTIGGNVLVDCAQKKPTDFDVVLPAGVKV
jgi:hypothetical protein